MANLTGTKVGQFGQDRGGTFTAGFQVGGGQIKGLGNMGPGMFIGPNGAQQYQQWLNQQGYQTSGSGSPTDPLRLTTQGGNSVKIPDVQMGGGYDVSSASAIGGALGPTGGGGGASSSSTTGAQKFGYQPGQWAPSGSWQDALYQDALARQQKGETNERGTMEDTLANEGWTDTSGLHMSAYGDIAERGGEARRGLAADSAERKRQAEQDEFQRWLAQEDLRLRASEIASRNQSASLSSARDEAGRNAEAYYARQGSDGGGGSSDVWDPFKKSVSQTSNNSNVTQTQPGSPQRGSMASKPAINLQQLASTPEGLAEIRKMMADGNRVSRYGVTYTQLKQAYDNAVYKQGTPDYNF